MMPVLLESGWFQLFCFTIMIMDLYIATAGLILTTGNAGGAYLSAGIMACKL